MPKLARSRLKYFATATALAAMALFAGPQSAAAGTYKPIHVFCNGGGNCLDGVQVTMAYSGLIRDGDGNLFGTTTGGGSSNLGGVVFEFSPPGPGQLHWQEKVLHRFCSAGGNCPDGKTPLAGVIADPSGNLYGTTKYGGGALGAGIVYELVRPTSGTVWTLRVLHRFCQAGGNCVDGKWPAVGLVRDSLGHLYGTTIFGGDANDHGVAFELIPASGGNWTYKVIYRFCAAPGCPDGQQSSGLTLGSDGNLYGAAMQGGLAPNAGLVYRFVPTNAARTSWNQEVLYRFCPGGYPPCSDGSHPVTNVTRSASGQLFGMTMQGGKNDHGVVYRLTPPASGTTYTAKVLHTFCELGGTCTDGSVGGASNATLLVKSGKIYGTTHDGGNISNTGVLFELDPPAPGGKWTEKVLHRFCGAGGTCSDGKWPQSGVIADTAGHLFGATSQGGNARGAGVIYEYAP